MLIASELSPLPRVLHMFVQRTVLHEHRDRTAATAVPVLSQHVSRRSSTRHWHITQKVATPNAAYGVDSKTDRGPPRRRRRSQRVAESRRSPRSTYCGANPARTARSRPRQGRRRKALLTADSVCTPRRPTQPLTTSCSTDESLPATAERVPPASGLWGERSLELTRSQIGPRDSCQMVRSMMSEGVDQFALLQFRVPVQVEFFGSPFQFFDRPFFVR